MLPFYRTIFLVEKLFNYKSCNCVFFYFVINISSLLFTKVLCASRINEGLFSRHKPSLQGQQPICIFSWPVRAESHQSFLKQSNLEPGKHLIANTRLPVHQTKALQRGPVFCGTPSTRQLRLSRLV